MKNLVPFGRDFMNADRSFFEDAFNYLNSYTSDFRVDIQDKEDHYLLEADLPGLAKEDIQLDYSNNTLSIGASKETGKDEKDEEGNFIRRERSTHSFRRQFYLDDVNESAITASFENGVLSVNLPKKEKELPQSKRIEIQ